MNRFLRCGVSLVIALAAIGIASPAHADVTTMVVGNTGTAYSPIALDSSNRLFAMAGSTIRIYTSPNNLTSPTTCAVTLAPSANEASRIAVDANGRVYLSFTNLNIVNVYDNPLSACTATPLQSINTGVNSFPRGVTIDSSGNLWVAIYGADAVRKYSTPATAPTLAASYSVPGGPAAIAFDGAGHAFATTTNTTAIYRADLTAGTIAFTDLGFTGINVPTDITAQSNGLIQVVNNGGQYSLVEFDTVTGSTSPTWTIDMVPFSSGNGLLYIVGPVGSDFYAGFYGGRLVSVSGLGIPSSGGNSDQAPPPILQQLPANADGSCTNISDAQFAYGTGLTGGWHPAWGEWLNDRKGGPVCSRTLVYNVNTSRWMIDA